MPLLAQARPTKVYSTNTVQCMNTHRHNLRFAFAYHFSFSLPAKQGLLKFDHAAGELEVVIIEVSIV